MAFHPSQLEGIVTATPTPVALDGSIDRSAVAAVVNHVVSGGAKAIAPAGGTGEYTALTVEQRSEVVRLTVEEANGRIPVIAGVLSPGLGEALAAVRDFTKLGVDMIMVVTPYYARPSPDGIVTYFKRIADATMLPLMLYEIPYRTGVQLAPETVERLVTEVGVAAMKTCSPDLGYQTRVMEIIGDKAIILTGEENVFPAHVAIGAKGGFLATSLLFPKAWEYLYRLASQGEMSRAVAFHRRLMPIVSMLYREHNPGPLRVALELAGMKQGDPLPPLAPASEETVRLLRQHLPTGYAIEAEAKSALQALSAA